jgi:hypothetical protein
MKPVPPNTVIEPAMTYLLGIAQRSPVRCIIGLQSQTRCLVYLPWRQHARVHCRHYRHFRRGTSQRKPCSGPFKRVGTTCAHRRSRPKSPALRRSWTARRSLWFSKNKAPASIAIRTSRFPECENPSIPGKYPRSPHVPASDRNRTGGYISYYFLRCLSALRGRSASSVRRSPVTQEKSSMEPPCRKGEPA